VVLVFRDVTEERKAEEALVAVSRSKDEFLAVLAHELRTPIVPIINAVEFLRMKGPPEPELQHLRDVIHRQAKQLARLVDDLLDIGRIVSGKLHVERERVDVNQIVQQAAEMCLPAIEQRGQTLDVALPNAPNHIDGDYTRLVEVVGNTLGNASKYTEERGRIDLTLSADGDRAVIRVRDNGLGISPDMLERIFERFIQIDTAAHRSRAGFGIGLALVKAIVDLHGGTVQARSEGFGRGSEFVVSLPLAAAPE
jgi:signal transduction histidine kinase